MAPRWGDGEGVTVYLHNNENIWIRDGIYETHLAYFKSPIDF